MTASATILTDLRTRYGASRVVLTAEEVAESLGSAPERWDAIRKSRGFPLAVKRVAGKPVVSIYDFADWLSEGFAPPPEKSRLPAPKRARASLAKSILALRIQQDFLGELAAYMERVELTQDAPDETPLPPSI
jgi:hypothetical protein